MTYKNVLNISLDTTSGRVQLLPGHAESFFVLQKGELRLGQKNKQKEVIQMSEGQCHVKDDLVTIIF